MKRALALLFLLAAGCPGARTEPVDAPAPARPVVPPTVGEKFVYKLLAGGERTDEVVAVVATSVTVFRTTQLGSKTGEPQTIEVPLDARAASKDAVSADAPKVKDETVTISGRAFACEVHEKTWAGGVGGKAKTARDWLSDQFPFVLRSESEAFTLLELSEIQAPAERLDVSHVRVGQRYLWKLAAGDSSVWEIVSKSEDKVIYKISRTVAGSDAPGKDEVHAFALGRKREAKDAPAGEKETLQVSGIDFPCTILETESGGALVRTWRSPRFPEVVKVQLGKDVTTELVGIEEGRRN
jgi:hypothetical protein